MPGNPFQPTVEDLQSLATATPSYDMITHGYAMGADPAPRYGIRGAPTGTLPWWMIPFAAALGASRMRTAGQTTSRSQLQPVPLRQPTVEPPFPSTRGALASEAVAELNPVGGPYNQPRIVGQPEFAPTSTQFMDRRQLMRMGPERQMGITGPEFFAQTIGSRELYPFPLRSDNSNMPSPRLQRQLNRILSDPSAPGPDYIYGLEYRPGGRSRRQHMYYPGVSEEMLPPSTDPMRQPSSNMFVTDTAGMGVPKGRQTAAARENLTPRQFDIFLEARSRGIQPEDAMAMARTERPTSVPVVEDRRGIGPEPWLMNALSPDQMRLMQEYINRGYHRFEAIDMARRNRGE